jgi:DEAD/DEAH box helicase domain-containing protein
MIPAVLAQQVRQGLEDFLRTTIPISTPVFHGLIDRLLEEEGAVFKGPYLSIQLPFRQGEGGPGFFPDVPLQFAPYLHQEQAFQRLSGDQPRSTIVATGTGSGKTECFLYPILDHCYRHRGEPGIKAILIYPMNALATDQAGRLARTIGNNAKLKGNVTTGLYVGQSEHKPHMRMAADSIITDKSTLRLNPPDILLTNYKMLDYLLIRPQDHSLWQHNEPETLRFLVVDELHTFDGAQGTDLACLIRRLKARLRTPQHFLCGVGTSATLGSEAEQHNLQDYAAKVFGEPFDADAMITESRLGAGEFLERSLISRVHLVPPEFANELAPESHDSYLDYVGAQYDLWFGEPISPKAGNDADTNAWRVKLGNELKGHLFFRNLLKVLGGAIRSYDEILDQLARVTPDLSNALRTYQVHLLNSMLALISEARVWAPVSTEDHASAATDTPGRRMAPFLHVQVQYWLRELGRMVAEVSHEPRLRFADDLKDDQLRQHLPIVHCRECGCTGWAGMKQADHAAVQTNLRDFYHGFFNHDWKVIYLFPEQSEKAPQQALSEAAVSHLCSSCLHLTKGATPETCTACGHSDLIRVCIPDSRKQVGNKKVSTHDCPSCHTSDILTVLGSRTASLASVLISQLYASGFNDDKKLLTFSDSVQDAAHRAGFFGARTYRFNFRSALQQCVRAEERAASTLTLAELPEAFRRYWSARNDEPTYIATFLAPNMMWFLDYHTLTTQGRLPQGSQLRDEVERRITWEIYSEYGFNARIGRTLEKTNSSVAHVNPERLDGAVNRLLESLHNEIGGMRRLDAMVLRRFLVGLLIHLKNQGAVLHPALNTYIQDWGNTYTINQHIHWMPNFGPRSRTPRFLTTKAGTRFEPLLSQSSRHRTWCQAWAETCFLTTHPLVSAETDRLYDLVLKALVAEDILEEQRVQGHRVWGIRSGVLQISCNVLQFRCQRCSHNVSVAKAEQVLWNDAPCLRFGCNGSYSEQEWRVDYYGKLYATGDVARIFTAEHTGLLERDERENLERQFKADAAERRPWYPNLLSCTPTLEMGIDIGDLSSVILCTVPPAQASYLQRIGRSGRRHGNALNLTVANARPHDLYFFAEPKDMLAGHVDPPGIFLDASAVLERQFTAFCFDRWVESGIPVTALPKRLGEVLDRLESGNEQIFPHNFLRFITSHRQDLFNRFVAMFESTLTPASISHLDAFVTEPRDQRGSLHYRIVDGLHRRRREREALSKKVRTLTGKLRRHEQTVVRDQHYNQHLHELQREKRALQKLITDMNSHETFNFFTDEGLIPNYAFPEAGVVLRSIIYRKKGEKQEDASAYDTWTYTYERPAASAIDELAPDNRFYAGGRKVQVDQVDMAVSEVEVWRFCPDCSHLELEGRATAQASCPRCGNTLWADEGQKRQMLRMRQVFATTSDRHSRIDDGADNREPAFYNKQMLVDIEEPHITAAYQVDSEALPWGFEFLSKVTFREINFGEKGEFGQQVAIAGVDMPRKGFTICKSCGKVQNHLGTIQHALTCTARHQNSDKHLTDCIYLYREFTSEAIRILLPVTTYTGSNRKLHSFVAAVQFGLKLQFGGSIDHLQTTVYEDPMPDSNYRKKYLVLYDTVPGGTGYLKQLMLSEKTLLEVFEKARTKLLSCACTHDPDKDGCYRCLYAYRNSYTMTETSRETAVDLLSDILQHRDALTRTSTLTHVSVNPLIESELEARFIAALQQARVDHQPVSMRNEPINGKPGYFLTIGGCAYDIEPQVTLGPADGVSIPTRADFVIRPARSQNGIKPIAVYTDGYLYHRDRIGQDMAQRMALVQSGRYLVWSLTWKDVENRYHEQKHYFENGLEPDKTPGGRNFSVFMQQYDLERFQNAHTADSFDWLLRLLVDPDEPSWQRYAYIHGLIRLNPDLGKAAWSAAVQAHVPEEIADLLMDVKAPCLYGHFEPLRHASSLQMFIASEHAAIQSSHVSGMRLACCLLDDRAHRDQEGFEAVWNGYLRLYNLFQFLPHAFFVTQDGVERRLYDGLHLSVWSHAETASEKAESAAWAELRELTSTKCHDLLESLATHGWPVPEAGYELTNAEGQIVATAELGWASLHVAFLRADELAYEQTFQEAGWQVCPLDDVLTSPEAYMLLHSANKRPKQ